MIIIPEIETVVILVPRTGSGSLRRAIAKHYPRSMLLYRHMEADGVPQGYDRWRKVGFVRAPLSRLWSLYKFLRIVTGEHHYVQAQRRSAERPFGDWLMENETVFTSPYNYLGGPEFRPEFTVRHPLPENRKSQWLYLRPDLGTTIIPYHRREAGARVWLNIHELGHENGTGDEPMPPVFPPALDYVRRVFAWDVNAVGGLTDIEDFEDLNVG